jgi:hypothetical protein
MDKIFFWITIVVVAVLGIFILKYIAAASNIDGFKAFMSNI